MNRYSRRVTCFCLGLLLAGALQSLGAANGNELSYTLEVEPVARDRQWLSLTAGVPLSGDAPSQNWSAEITASDGSSRTAQVERFTAATGPGLKVHWVEPQVAGEETATFSLTLVPAESADEGKPRFRFEEKEEHADLFFGDRGITRYVTVYDPERHADTHKPYHHVYGFHGEGFITKGPGGLYPHHKGIFLGWNQTALADGERYDFWHGQTAYLEHRKFLLEPQVTGPVLARTASVTDWKTPDGQSAIEDTREMTVWNLGEDQILLDYVISIKPLMGDIFLGGDAHHAGFQFRASQEVADNSDDTVIIRPAQSESEGNGIWTKAPWMALHFDISGNPYTVIHLDHTENNPKPTTYSTRDYGRFGAFFTAPVQDGDPLVLKYRIVVKGTDGVSPEEIDALHADYLDEPSVRVLPR